MTSEKRGWPVDKVKLTKASAKFNRVVLARTLRTNKNRGDAKLYKATARPYDITLAGSTHVLNMAWAWWLWKPTSNRLNTITSISRRRRSAETATAMAQSVVGLRCTDNCAVVEIDAEKSIETTAFKCKQMSTA
ncbi:hypothetical protein H257_17764 [Aphanomyces astaci]|uniref:Uncharacterized protein n=1 Tax=Aphanomyces astaci TaxID=112090 RepID=W4FFR6_APHAT|nr:hypothetical protein H257_17764 [Aphanomyces astaci]ETV65568.1 hypothetical protein H257_17764 [Aphanomyces astaci]|eukprot:XP_009844957.1 hypothetical protein H257_17764 [Aphanomyces astaci]